jgi:hypothetical protein
MTFFGTKRFNALTPWHLEQYKKPGRKPTSRLVMAGVGLRTVQELMGYKDISMTLRYAHLSPDHKRAAMETLEARFAVKSPSNFHNSPVAAPVGDSTKVAAIR